MTVYAITDTKNERTGIAPTYLQTTPTYLYNNSNIFAEWRLTIQCFWLRSIWITVLNFWYTRWRIQDLSHNCWNTSVEIRCIKTSQEETTTTTFVVRVCKSDPLSHIRIFGYFKSQIRIFIRILINTTFTCCMHPQAYDCWLTSSCALCLTFVIFWIDLFNICCNL